MIMMMISITWTTKKNKNTTNRITRTIKMLQTTWIISWIRLRRTPAKLNKRMLLWAISSKKPKKENKMLTGIWILIKMMILFEIFYLQLNFIYFSIHRKNLAYDVKMNHKSQMWLKGRTNLERNNITRRIGYIFRSD